MSRVAIGVVDSFILAEVPKRLQADYLATADIETRIRSALIRVQLTDEAVIIKLRREAATTRASELGDRSAATDAGVEFVLPISLKHRQGAYLIEAPGAATSAGRMDRALVRAVALAQVWSERLAIGDVPSIHALADSEGYCSRYAARLLPLAWLAPDLKEAILTGRQPGAVSLGALTKQPLPVNWDDQRRLFATIGRV